MTSVDLILNARFLLHDTDRASDTDQRFYSDSSIAIALTESLAVLMRDLILPRDPKSGERMPRTAHLSVAPLAALFGPTWTGTAPNASAPLPDDFFILECGTLNGTYVPALPVPLASAIAGLSIAKLYAFAGVLLGPQVDACYYFQRPPAIVPQSLTALGLSDAVLNTAKFAACRDLMVQHAKSGYQRWLFFENEYKTAKGTLQ